MDTEVKNNIMKELIKNVGTDNLALAVTGIVGLIVSFIYLWWIKNDATIVIGDKKMSLLVSQNEYWIRVNLALEICIKEALIEVVHNKRNDPTYVGIPDDGTDLCNRMQAIRANNGHPLHRARLSNEQWDKLCPTTGRTNIQDWDITLLIAVIRSEVGLSPLGGWNITTVNPNDNSIGGLVFLARQIRNSLKHGTLNDIITPAQFNSYWNKIETILQGLKYSRINIFHQLKTEPLDPHIATIGKILKDLMNEVDGLKDMASDNAKDIEHLIKYIEYLKKCLKHLLSTKADKRDLDEKADRIELDQKVDKCEFQDLKEVVDNRSKENRSLQEKCPIKWNIYQPIRNFHGRQELLEEIHCQLQIPSEDDHKPIVLYGMGGIGKTQTAAMYIKMYRDTYLNIIWINSPSMKQSLIEILQFISNKSFQSNASIECLSQMLSIHIQNQKTLLIIDDMKDIQEFQKLLRNLVCHIKPFILVTTQNGNLDCGVYHLHQVKCFDETESISFLRKQLPNNTSDTKNLADLLQSFPLAMQQAACHIKKYKTSIEKYIQQFNNSNKTLLNINIAKYGLTEYEKTLLTVWKLAFKELTSSPNALNILGMMAYMDHNYINRHTFLHYDGITDGMELNKVTELLCEFSLVSPNGMKLQIHPLVQKVIQLSIDKKLIHFEQEPLELLFNLLLRTMSMFENDTMHTDEQNLWYPHLCLMTKRFPRFFDMKFFLEVALHRLDESSALNWIEQAYNLEVQLYNENKDFDKFIDVVCLHKLLIHVKARLRQLSIDELVTFESVYKTELKGKDRQIILWKLQQAAGFSQLNRAETFEEKIMEIYDMIHTKTVDYDTVVLPILANHLYSFDLVKCKEIMSKCVDDDTYLESLSLRNEMLYLQGLIAVREVNLLLADETLVKWKKMISDNNIPYNHFIYFKMVELTIIILIKRCKYDKALQKVNETIAANPLWWNELRIFKVAALIKLKKYKDALATFMEPSMVTLGADESFLLAYMMFLRHEFDGIYELLDTELRFKDLHRNIHIYEIVLAEVNRKRKSVETSRAELDKLLKDCLDLKRFIIATFECKFDYF